MSIFTKIFVVLDMLLAVILVALVVPFVVNSNTYRTAYQNEFQLRQAAEYSAANRETDIGRMLQTKQTQIDEQKDQIAALTTRIGERVAEVQGLQAEVVRLQSDNTNFGAQLAQLASAERQHAQINEMLQKEIVALREENLNLEKRAIELAAELRNRTTEVATLTQLNRRNKEIIEDLTQQLEQALASAAAGPRQSAPSAGSNGLTDEVSPVHSAGPIVQGVITEVRQVGDSTLISMNLGTNDRVQEGMKFVIHRGDNYVGDAVVTNVDFNASAARVTLKTAQPQVNDEVLAGGGL